MGSERGDLALYLGELGDDLRLGDHDLGRGDVRDAREPVRLRRALLAACHPLRREPRERIGDGGERLVPD